MLKAVGTGIVAVFEAIGSGLSVAANSVAFAVSSAFDAILSGTLAVLNLTVSGIVFEAIGSGLFAYAANRCRSPSTPFFR